jgi:hypothetical protein
MHKSYMFLWFGMFIKQINRENVYSSYINSTTVCSIILTPNTSTVHTQFVIFNQNYYRTVILIYFSSFSHSRCGICQKNGMNNCGLYQLISHAWIQSCRHVCDTGSCSIAQKMLTYRKCNYSQISPHDNRTVKRTSQKRKITLSCYLRVC